MVCSHLAITKKSLYCMHKKKTQEELRNIVPSKNLFNLVCFQA